MRYLATSFVLFFCFACGDTELPKLPLRIATTIEEAKQIARDIASQKCEYAGYKDLGIDEDYGARRFDCDHGQYILELGQSHIFVQQFSWEVGDEVRFRYSDKYLMKPVFLRSAKPRETNPAYYLEPIHPTRSEVKPLKGQLEEIGVQIGEMERILAEKLRLNPALANNDEVKNIQHRLERLKKTYGEIYKQLLQDPEQGEPLLVPETVIVEIIRPNTRSVEGGFCLYNIMLQ